MSLCDSGSWNAFWSESGKKLIFHISQVKYIWCFIPATVQNNYTVDEQYIMKKIKENRLSISGINGGGARSISGRGSVYFFGYAFSKSSTHLTRSYSSGKFRSYSGKE
jgi:hypothetical protein